MRGKAAVPGKSTSVLKTRGAASGYEAATHECCHTLLFLLRVRDTPALSRGTGNKLQRGGKSRSPNNPAPKGNKSKYNKEKYLNRVASSPPGHTHTRAMHHRSAARPMALGSTTKNLVGCFYVIEPIATRPPLQKKV